MFDVLIAISDPLAALGLSVLVDQEPDMRCAGVLTPSDSIRERVAHTPARVVVLDVQYRRDDPALVPDLARQHPDVRVLVAVDHSAEECGLRHFLERKAGVRLAPEAVDRLDDCCLTSLRQEAHGCLGQGAEPEAVLRSIRTVADGEIAAAPWMHALARRLQGCPDLPREEPLPAITERELEVLACLGEGLNNAEIARQLGLREQTVKNHISKAMAKLGAESRLEVGLLASRFNLRLLRDAVGPASD